MDFATWAKSKYVVEIPIKKSWVTELYDITAHVAMHSHGPRNEGHYSDALAIKAIVPEKVQHDGGEQIAIIFNHRLNMDRKAKDQYVVDFVGTAGVVKVQATLANSSTLMLQTPVFKEPSVITAYVYQGIHRRLIGQHKIEFLSRSDTFYRLLYKSLDPVIFMCETLGIVSGDIHELDNALAETFSANAPQGFDFLGIHREGADQSSAEFPTLLHFACKFGLSKLVEVILRYPGAYEACSLKNYQGHRPYNIAEDNGYDLLANELRAFHDQKDPDASYIDMEPNNKDGDVYVKVQKEDGSYYYVLRKEADNELYIDLDDKPEHEEYYVKMQKEGGGYYYVPMKPGAGPKKIDHVVDKAYSNVEGRGEHYQEDIYENLNQTDPSPESQEIYEDMDGEGNVGSEELYMDMEHSEKSTTISGGVQHGADEELYMDMANEGEEATEELYTDMEGAGESPSELYISMEQEQKPDKYGYVTPRSNQPVTTDAVLFNRSASSAAEVRARQLADAERKSRSLPGGVSQVDILEQAIRQSVISGKISDKEASQFLQKLEILPRRLEERRGSTGSKASISTASSSGSSSSGVSSGHELGPRDEPFEGASIEEEEEDTHLSRAEILGHLHRPKDEPPTPPRPDYHQRDKTTGSSDSSSRRQRHKTAPVETKDLPGMLSASGSRLPPPVQRRSSSPGGVSYNTQLKEPSSERQRPPEPIPESTPPKVAPRPSPRPPLSAPSDATRSPAPIPPSERVRQAGVPVLPMPTAKGTTPPQPPRRPPRSPRN